MTAHRPPIQDWTVRAVFRKNVKDLRKEARNLTQQALAERLEELDWQGHMSSATIAKIEKGERQVKIEEAIMIAQALRVGLVDLLRPPPGQSQFLLLKLKKDPEAFSKLPSTLSPITPGKN